MIFRDSQIRIDSDEIRFKISYSHIDCKRWLQQYLVILIKCDMDDFSESEASIRYWLEHDIFKAYPVKYSERLSQWVIATSLRKKFLSVSASNPTLLIFSETIIKKATISARE